MTNIQLPAAGSRGRTSPPVPPPLLPAQRGRWMLVMILLVLPSPAIAQTCPRGDEPHCCARLESLRDEYAGRTLTMKERAFKTAATAWHRVNCITRPRGMDYSGMRGSKSRW